MTAANSGGSATQSFTLTIVAQSNGPANILAVSGNGQSTVVNSAFPVTLNAQVLNSNGTGVSGVTVTFTSPSSGPSATLNGALSASYVTGGNGHAKMNATANSIAGGPYVVTATVAGLATSATFSLTNTSH
jgi:hypothetical protein